MFLAAHRSLLNGTAPREPAAWLATIARNECWGRIRTRMREPLPTAEVEGEHASSDPVAEAIRNADLAAMWSAMRALPQPQREALLLREFGGLSYDELAGALAVSGAAVESLLFRARQSVRTRLEAAYAGVTGGSWLESVARLAGGLGGGMAPVAAKVAAIGVGAAVATGGAVVAPRILDHRSAAPRTPRPAHAAIPAAATTRSSAAVSTLHFVSARTVGAMAHPAGASHAGEDGGTITEARQSGVDRSSSADESRSTSSDHSGSGDHEDAAAPVTSKSGKHSGDSSELAQHNDVSSGGDGSSGDGSSGEGSDHHGSSGGGDGGAAETTTNPVLPAPVPPVEASPAVTVPVSDEH